MRCNRCGHEDCAEKHETGPSRFVVGAEVYWIGGGMDRQPTLGLFLGLGDTGLAKFGSDSGTTLVDIDHLEAKEKWPVLT